MESLKELYRIGYGPSSSHTMGPRKAAELYREKTPKAASYEVTLYGSLAATGKGHQTDTSIMDAMKPINVAFLWKPEIELPRHPNAMTFKAMDSKGKKLDEWTVYSIGGGAITDSEDVDPPPSIYPKTTMNEILAWTKETGRAMWEYVEEVEGTGIYEHLKSVWKQMQASIANGIEQEGMLPGGLHLRRKASPYYVKALTFSGPLRRQIMVFSHALAVAEENASGGKVVTAPTCGSCGVLPAVLKHIGDTFELSETKILRALATAGLIGNIVKQNASISGAEVGCQGEIGTACSMAAGAAAELLGGSPSQVEYAAEMGLEHHLGMTCDPIAGLVQIPCIERNTFAAERAINCATYALLSDGRHLITFDRIVKTMNQTGHDLPNIYKETSAGGLAVIQD